MKINVNQLWESADAFIHENFGFHLDVPVRVSNRMKMTLGSFKIRNGQAKEIAMSGEFIRNHSEGEVLDVLHHECVHFALYRMGRPYRDADSTFKATVDRLGVSRTRTYQYKGKAYLYVCTHCGQRHISQIKGYDKRYICGYCRHKIKNAGEVQIG